MALRYYQENAISDIKIEFAKGNFRIILQAATGAGKTFIFCEIARLVNQKKNSVIIITDRKELLTQSGNTLEKFNIMPVFLTANEKEIPQGRVVISMSETLKRRLKNESYVEFIQKFDLIIIDEAHKQSFNKIFEALTEKQKVIGATATPYRWGKMQELKNFYDSIVNTIEIDELIEKGFLSKPKYFGVPVDLSGVRTTGNDYNEKDLGEVYNKQELFDGVVKNYNSKTPNTKALVFSATIENSIKLCTDFQSAGIDARHLDSKMNKITRETILDDFKNNKFKILCNVGILTTGFDDPSTETIILYRATKSLPLYLQMVGRGSRTTDTKKEFTILDFGNNIQTHDFWHIKRTWTLENPKKQKKTKGAAIVKECPNCEALIPANAQKCSECGFEYPKPEKTSIEIILEEMTPSEVQRLAGSGTLTIAELEEVRALKGYKIGWICYKFKTKEEFFEYEKARNFKKGWAHFNIKKYLQI